MLTIKHVSMSGHEDIYSAESIGLYPETPVSPRQLFCRFSNGDVKSITHGTAYVMNEAGKTVERYILNLEPQSPQTLGSA